MPYVTEWVPAEIALEYKDCVVYNCYQDNESHKRLEFWFTGDSQADSYDGDDFDIRDHSKNPDPIEALKEMIDSGEYQKLCQQRGWEESLPE